MDKNPEIVTPNDVYPDLVSEAEFGKHSSRVRANERIWKFESYIMANKFMKVSHLPKYKRKGENG